MAGTRHAAAATVSRTIAARPSASGSNARRAWRQCANQRQDRQRRAGAGEEPERDQRQALAQHHPQHAHARRTERQADAEFPPPLLHGIADDAGNPGGRDHQRQHREKTDHRCRHAGRQEQIVAERLQRAEVIDGLLRDPWQRSRRAHAPGAPRRAGSIGRASASTAGCSGRAENNFLARRLVEPLPRVLDDTDDECRLHAADAQ